MQFEVGDKVAWVSLCNTKLGCMGELEHVGTVVHTVFSMDHPLHCFSDQTFKAHRIMFDGLFRRGESYLVSVPSKTGKGKPRLYWPRVSALRRARWRRLPRYVRAWG